MTHRLWQGRGEAPICQILYTHGAARTASGRGDVRRIVSAGISSALRVVRVRGRGRGRGRGGVGLGLGLGLG